MTIVFEVVLSAGLAWILKKIESFDGRLRILEFKISKIDSKLSEGDSKMS